MYKKDQQKGLNAQTKDFLKTIETVGADQLTDLRKVLVYHEWRYYVLNEPLVSDYEYDSLYKQLEKIEQDNPGLITPDSPTQRVSNDLTSDFSSVPHLTPMLSLGNSYNLEDLSDFDTQIRKMGKVPEDEKIDYHVELKFDGGSIALVYENDLLVRGATRGNGVKGEEITSNTKTIPSIPLKAQFSKHKIHKAEIRGEVLIRKDVFKQLNEQRQKEGLTLFANPRNSAAGGLRMKDPKDASKRKLVAFVYQMGFAQDKDGKNLLPGLKTHRTTLELMANLGFKVGEDLSKVCKGIKEVFSFCKKWEEKRESYPYEIDGMVIKVNSLALQEKCGFTAHHPRWAIAFKFKAKQASSTLLDVEYQVGKVGSITPVAKIEPVSLAGVTISSISLHNEEFITSKDLKIGDQVLVERAGDVIPYIVKSLSDSRDGSEMPIEFPTNCPSCQTALVKSEGEAAWRCPNYDCEAQVLQRMIHHVSKDAMDIDGFGRSYVERFQALGWLKNLPDIYRLDYAAIEDLEGFGAKSAQKLRSSIETAKKNPIKRLLYSLVIHHLGKKVSTILAKNVDHVLDLQNWTIEDYTHLKDVGPVVAQNMVDFFANADHVEMLKEMEGLGVNLSQTEDDRPKVISQDAPLVGKSILFTGSLQTMGRKEAQEKAAGAGARNVSAVSGKLDILVVGEKAGSKLKKARALGSVQIMTEEEFNALFN
ncbi:MAG: NAD-dependent DNA ligase LigA [Saprospiraceae bacterium]|nr:NAD-dependent DNA ligase LigA [Saprospiraceae bacterium]